jgi:hypothetical protein
MMRRGLKMTMCLSSGRTGDPTSAGRVGSLARLICRYQRHVLDQKKKKKGLIVQMRVVG